MTEPIPILGPGAPKGGAKPPGSGRRKGVGNKRTKEVEAVWDPIARRMGKKLEKRFNEELAKGDKANLNFCDSFFAKAAGYAWGQPTKRSEISGRDGGPILKQTQIVEASARVADVFAAAAGSDDPAEQMDDESLGAVQAVNFITAEREAQARIRVKAGPATDALTSALPAEPEPAAEPTPDPGPVKPIPPQPGHTIAFMDSGLRIVGLNPDREGLPPLYALHGSVGLIRRGNWKTVLGQARKQAGGDLGAFVVQQPRPSNDPLLLAPNR